MQFNINKKINLKKALIFIIPILIIAIVIIIYNINNKNDVYCTISFESIGNVNEKVKLMVNAYGQNAKVETNFNQLTESSYYELIVQENGIYTFSSISKNKRSSCKINIDNIFLEKPSVYLMPDTEEETLSLNLKIVVSDNYKLASNPFSFDGINFTDNNILNVLSNGTYMAYVKDSTGNITTISYRVTNIGISTSLLMEMGASKILIQEDIDFKYTSDNPYVAVVNDNGVVSAKNIGFATIRAVLSNDEVRLWNINVVKPKVIDVILNEDSFTLKPNEERLVVIKEIIPNNTSCDTISFNSSNPEIATVNAGVIKGISSGNAVITATCDDIITNINVNVKIINDPIVVSSSYKKYETNTLKYYIQENKNYYLTYIWMEDPYNQIKKLDSNTAIYGKIMVDEEFRGKDFNKLNVGEMINKYVEMERIPFSKGIIAYNASAFYSNFDGRISDNWFVLNDGVITRNIHADNKFTTLIIGIDKDGNLKIYGNSATALGRVEIANKIINDKVKNTFTFFPTLIENGEKKEGLKTTVAYRQAICQINSNNYVMLTSTNKISIDDTATALLDIGCQTAFNLDGGGSTSMFYKNPYERKSTQLTCNGGDSTSYCRSIVEGIYFTEK